jgi:hypothetical protein
MRSTINSWIAVLLVASLLTGCATSGNLRSSDVSSLELRGWQTRTYDSSDNARAYKVLENVLQDEHYVIENSDAGAGLLSARRVMKLEDTDMKPADRVWVKVAIGVTIVAVVALLVWVFSKGNVHGCGWASSSISVADPSPGMAVAGDSQAPERLVQLSCTLNVTPWGTAGSEVRASFERAIIDSRGAMTRVEPVNEAEYYREFFSKVDKAFFLDQQQTS